MSSSNNPIKKTSRLVNILSRTKKVFKPIFLNKKSRRNSNNGHRLNSSSPNKPIKKRIFGITRERMHLPPNSSSPDTSKNTRKQNSVNNLVMSMFKRLEAKMQRPQIKMSVSGVSPNSTPDNTVTGVSPNSQGVDGNGLPAPEPYNDEYFGFGPEYNTQEPAPVRTNSRKSIKTTSSKSRKSTSRNANNTPQE